MKIEVLRDNPNFFAFDGMFPHSFRAQIFA